MAQTLVIDPYGFWTFIGTMVLAAATVVLAVITVWSTRRSQEGIKREWKLTELRTRLNEYYGPLVYLLSQGNNTDCQKLIDLMRTKSYLRDDSIMDPLLLGCGIFWDQRTAGQYCAFTYPDKDIWPDFFDRTWKAYTNIKKEISVISGTNYMEEEKPPYKIKVAKTLFNPQVSK